MDPWELPASQDSATRWFWRSTRLQRPPGASSPGGRKAIPKAKDSGRSIPISLAHFRKKSWGIGVRSPAPSPLRPSASNPPRCERRASAASARSTTSREDAPPSWAMNPTPHASWSTLFRQLPDMVKTKLPLYVRKGTNPHLMQPINLARDGTRGFRAHFIGNLRGFTAQTFVAFLPRPLKRG